MKRFILLCLGIVLIFALAMISCGGEEHGSLTLMQNKPEIGPMLQAYGEIWSARTEVPVTIKSIGGSSGSSVGQQLRADYAAGEMPDIFVIDGIESYKEWENIILDLSNEEWVKDTSVAFTVDQKVYGFPVSIEGWGMAYNADMLSAAGINPAKLTNLGAYREAFSKLESMKEELGIDSVVSMGASAELSWVTAHHNFNSLLSNGLSYGDTSMVDDIKAGRLNQDRLTQYADWVELLYTYADPTVLTTGNYDGQVGAFASGRAVFLHQGNWVDPNLAAAKANFKMGFAPHGSMESDTNGIFVSAPSFYVINAESENVELAKQFLKDLVYTEEGNNYMVKEAGMIPAFGNVNLNPSGQLSRSVQEWAAAGKVYSWNQYLFTSAFRDQTLAAIYNQFATGQIDKEGFIAQMNEAFQSL